MTTATAAIDSDKAIELLRRAVNERGADHRAFTPLELETGEASCLYFNPVSGQPSCIVGQAFSYLGYNYGDFGDVNGSMIHVVREVVPMTDDAADIFAAAQGVQDQGRTWGDAFDEAVRTEQSLSSQWSEID